MLFLHDKEVTLSDEKFINKVLSVHPMITLIYVSIARFQQVGIHLKKQIF